MTSLALNFYETVIPHAERARHAKAGVTRVHGYAADVSDGQLRVLTSYDPTEPFTWEHHVSASVGKPGAIGSFRRPTDDEMAAVKSLWSLEQFEEIPTDHPHVRHHCGRPEYDPRPRRT